MSDFFYPDLPMPVLRSLDTVRSLIQEHAGYFLEAPYSTEQEKLLRSWFLNRAVQADLDAHEKPEEDPRHVPYEGLQAELKQLYGDLKGAKPNAGEDRISYLKTATGLLTKITELELQATNLKSMSDFQQAILNFLDDVCSPSQREEFLKRLRSVTPMKPQVTEESPE